MKERPAKNVAASVRQRLLNLSRDRNEPFDLVLVRYGLERFLYRIGISPFAKNFMLKGALLFLVWGQDDHRPTRDADLLAAGSNDLREMEETFKKICAITGDDGIVFDAGTVRAQEIAEEKAYSARAVRIQPAGLRDLAAVLSLRLASPGWRPGSKPPTS